MRRRSTRTNRTSKGVLRKRRTHRGGFNQPTWHTSWDAHELIGHIQENIILIQQQKDRILELEQRLLKAEQAFYVHDHEKNKLIAECQQEVERLKIELRGGEEYTKLGPRDSH